MLHWSCKQCEHGSTVFLPGLNPNALHSAIITSFFLAVTTLSVYPVTTITIWYCALPSVLFVLSTCPYTPSFSESLTTTVLSGNLCNAPVCQDHPSFALHKHMYMSIVFATYCIRCVRQHCSSHATLYSQVCQSPLVPHRANWNTESEVHTVLKTACKTLVFASSFLYFVFSSFILRAHSMYYIRCWHCHSLVSIPVCNAIIGVAV